MSTADRLTRVALILGGVLLITALDYYSGVEIRIFPLYYAPIAVAAWYFDRVGAVGATLLCAFGWFWSNQLAGMAYSHPIVWVVNTVVQAASFATVGLLVARLKVAIGRARALSRTDPLCPLLNSRAFYEECDRVLATCRQNGHPVTLAYLDLDNFKSVNDTLGHKAGDDLLRAVAAVLRSCGRSSDLAARIGGDEFAVLMPSLDADGARASLERIRHAVTGVISHPTCAVTVSIGAATFLAAPLDVEAMVQRADAIMYSAKLDGKNRVHLDVIDHGRAMGAARSSIGAPTPSRSRLALDRRDSGLHESPGRVEVLDVPG